MSLSRNRCTLSSDLFQSAGLAVIHKSLRGGDCYRGSEAIQLSLTLGAAATGKAGFDVASGRVAAMVRAKRNPLRKEAEMSLPSMTTAFCLSGIAGLALTSAAMPPIGDGSSHHQLRCELSADAAPCASIAVEATHKPGYSATVSPGVDISRSHCRTAANGSWKRAQVEIAANCVGRAAAASLD